MKITKHTPSHLRFLAACACATLASTFSVEALTVAYEGFDIPPGEIDNTRGQTSWGWKSIADIYIYPWWAWNQGINDYYHAVSDGGLEYEGLPSTGNAFVFTEEVFDQTTFNWVYRPLQKFYSYNSTGQLWFSVLVNPKVAGDPAGGGWFQVCLSNLQNDVYLGLANVNDQTVWSGGGERLKLNGVQGEKWAYSEVPVEDGVTAFLVMHLDFDNKTAFFYVDPPVDAADPGTPVAEFTMWTDMYIERIMFWSLNAGPSVEGEGADYIGSMIDEVRLGTTYASVAAGANLTDPGSGPVDTTPPVITGPSGDPGASTSVASVPENMVRVFTMLANETVIWSLSGGADKDFFTINAGTGGLSFKTFPDFEVPADANTDGVYVVQVKALDEGGNFSVQDISVTVTDIEDEVLPVITGLSGQPGDAETTATIPTGTSVVGTYTADEAVTWDLSGGADEADFQIDAESGELSFVIAPDINSPADADADNVYEVEVRATDASLNAGRQLVLVTVVEGVPQYGPWPIVSDVYVDSGSFLGWLNISGEPWLWNLAMNKYMYIPQSYIQASGAWVYIPNPTPPPGGDNTWAGWPLVSEYYVDSGAFFGWLNVSGGDWVWSVDYNKYIYMPESFVQASGAWAYIPI